MVMCHRLLPVTPVHTATHTPRSHRACAHALTYASEQARCHQSVPGTQVQVTTCSIIHPLAAPVPSPHQPSPSPQSNSRLYLVKRWLCTPATPGKDALIPMTLGIWGTNAQSAREGMGVTVHKVCSCPHQGPQVCPRTALPRPPIFPTWAFRISCQQWSH